MPHENTATIDISKQSNQLIYKGTSHENRAIINIITILRSGESESKSKDAKKIDRLVKEFMVAFRNCNLLKKLMQTSIA